MYTFDINGALYRHCHFILQSIFFLLNVGMANENEVVDELDLSLIGATAASVTLEWYNRYLCKKPCMVSSFTGNRKMMEIMQGNEKRCLNMFRMEKHVFWKLCEELQVKYNFCGSRELNCEELLGMFLYTLGHGVSNRNVQETFQHSGETVSRNFSYVLDVMAAMSIDIVKPIDPQFKEVPTKIKNDQRYWPHFKVKRKFELTTLFFYTCMLFCLICFLYVALHWRN